MQGTDGRSRGFGTVLYASHEDAKRAIGMHKMYIFPFDISHRRYTQ